MLERRELADWLTLLACVGRRTARPLLQRHGDPAAVLREARLPPPRHEPAIEASWAWLQGSAQRSLLCLGDADYPEALLAAPDPPLLLFLEGERRQLGAPAVAIVGSRAATPQGEGHARDFAQALAAAGWVVVSGLARGIDAAAHQGALQAGATWAVLGCGLDAPYPAAHRPLAAEIAACGLLISEHPPGTPPLAAHFPARNRLIAGLSQGCLVVEAALQSGSLITARLALEAGREVFALPGPLRAPQSAGCHALIQQGAQLVTEPADLLRTLAPQRLPLPKAAPVQRAQADDADPLLAALGFEPCGLDALQARLGWSTAALQARLLTLELDGRLRALPGGRFERC